MSSNILEETSDVARATLDALAAQRQQLANVEAGCDQMEHEINRGKRILQNMTFWGRLTNFFFGPPECAPAPPPSPPAQTQTPQSEALIDEIHEMAVAMGDEIDKQNASLSGITHRMDPLQEELIRMSKRLR